MKSTKQKVSALTDDALRVQVGNQYRVIVHLCRTIASVHEQLGQRAVIDAHDRSHLEFLGGDTLSRMNALGDLVNEMDAVIERDEWTFPIFEQGNSLWSET